MRKAIILLTILCYGCLFEKRKSDKKEDPKGEKIQVSKYPNGKKKAEVPYKDGKRNGMSRTYDSKGNITLELPYVNDKREGRSKKYYEGGKQAFQTTEYKNDKIHGMQVKYRQNGAVMSEARFENGFPCNGLKQYLTDNTLKQKYPQIVIRPIDMIESTGTYVLEISMSEKVGEVRYYTGKLSPSGCLTDNLYFVFLDQARKTGILKYDLQPGGFIMEELNIIAAVETLQGNTYITQRKYNLAIDN
ncbi:MAG TPA: hypothetical protein VF141_11040 [Chryseolinea sp.]